jgi:hypothetical protein
MVSPEQVLDHRKADDGPRLVGDLDLIPAALFGVTVQPLVFVRGGRVLAGSCSRPTSGCGGPGCETPARHRAATSSGCSPCRDMAPPLPRKWWHETAEIDVARHAYTPVRAKADPGPKAPGVVIITSPM